MYATHLNILLFISEKSFKLFNAALPQETSEYSQFNKTKKKKFLSLSLDYYL